MISDKVRVVLKNSAWILSEKVLKMMLGLFVTALLARYLGPSAYGEYNYIFSILSFFFVIQSLGVANVVVRDLSIDQSRECEVLGTVLLAKIIVGFILSVIFYIFVYESNWTFLVMTAISLGIIFQSNDVIELWFQSQQVHKKIVIARVVSYLAINSIMVMFILNQLDVHYFFINKPIEVFIYALVLTFLYRRSGGNAAKWKFEVTTLRDLIKESFPYLLSSMSIVIYMRIDQILIMKYINAHELGVYSTATTISSVFNVIPVTMAMGLMPYMSKLRNENYSNYIKAMRFASNIAFYISFLICIFTLMFSEDIVILLFGEQYLNAVPILKVHVFTNIFMFLGVVQGIWAIQEKKGKAVLYRTMFGCLVAVCSNVVLIPVIGIKGAAISSILAQVSSVILINFILDRELLSLQLKAVLFRF